MSTRDPLAEFRGSGAGALPTASPRAPGGSSLEHYEAFRASDRARFMLWFRVNRNNTSADVAASYGYLQTTFSDSAGFFIGLRYAGFLSVRVRGRNLQGLLPRILAHEVEWVQEFDSNRCRNPAAGQPLIATIEVRVNEALQQT